MLQPETTELPTELPTERPGERTPRRPLVVAVHVVGWSLVAWAAWQLVVSLFFTDYSAGG
jgi:hypothetical protein